MFKKLFFLIGIFAIMSCQEKVDKSTEEGTAQVPESDVTRTTAEKIALKTGEAMWKDVSEIQFTFNVDRGESHYERSWIWNPKSDDVTLRTKEDTIAYNRKQMDSIAKQTDQGFVNDSYWLLAPYKLVWDEGTNFTEEIGVSAPISKEKLDVLTVTYGEEGGYTPGDAYDFYYDEDYMIREWIFRKGNASSPSMITTFEDYKKFNGLSLATMHKDSTGAFKLYFTNISVKK